MKFPSMFRRAPVAVEAKESAVAATLVMTPGQPIYPNRDYEAFATEGYAQNVIAFKAVNSIADAVASVKWLVFAKDGETEITQGPAVDLLAQPNPEQGTADYLRSKTSFFMIAGNAYEEHIVVGGFPREIYQLRPDRMRVVKRTDGSVEAYQYKVAGKTTTWPVAPDGTSDVSHLKTFNPTDDTYGLSPFEACHREINTSASASKWMDALLQNSARPSGALAMKDGATLGDDQFARLQAQIEEQYSGPRNAGRPMLLEGGLEWQAMGLSPHDVGIVETKNSAARDIARAFGVPPMLLGIPGDATYSNYQEARSSFWEDTVLPLVMLMAEDWQATIGDVFGVEIRPDFDDVPAIVDKRATLWTMADASTDLTINERREMKGYEPIDGGDVLPGAIAPIVDSFDTEDAAEEPDVDEDEADPPITDEEAKAIAYGLGFR